MKRTTLILLIATFAYFFGAQAQESTKLDSLQFLLNEANHKDSIDYLMLIGEEHFLAENYSTSLDYFFTSLKLAEAIHHINGSANAANSIGRVYYNMENFEQGLKYFNMALKYFQLNDDEQGEGGAYNNIALIYYEIDSINLAIEYYKLALEIKEKEGDKLDIAAIHHNMGLVYISQKSLMKLFKALLHPEKYLLSLVMIGMPQILQII